MRVPDFLIIGAQKCGTTAAMSYLGRHPHIGFNATQGDNREVHFFDRDDRWAAGVEWYLRQSPTPAPMLGEKTPNYFRPAAIERIAQTLPHARLIVLLRDPVKRAYSQWNHFNQQPAAAGWGWRVRAFEQMIEERPALLELGHYDDALAALYGHFPRSQIHVEISERAWRSPAAAYNRLFRFLGLSPIEFGGYARVHARTYLQRLDGDTRARLNEYFAPRVQRVQALLDDPLPEWDAWAQ